LRGEDRKARNSGGKKMSKERRYFPWVTLVLILGNCAVFLGTADEDLQIREGVALSEGFVPSDFFRGERPGMILTHIFLHANLSHLASNMIALLFLGLALESRIGNAQFLAIYLVCGVLAALIFGILDPTSVIPSVGASAAIFGIMGTLTILYPGSFVFIFIIPVPVILVAVFYALTTISFIQAGDTGPVAHVAHLAGMISGVAVAFVKKPEDALKGLVAFILVFIGVVIMIQLL
jgi:membrane associated rhomboid family serine protease